MKEKVLAVISSVVYDAINIDLSDSEGKKIIEFDTYYFSIRQFYAISRKLRDSLNLYCYDCSFFPSLDVNQNGSITVSINYY